MWGPRPCSPRTSPSFITTGAVAGKVATPPPTPSSARSKISPPPSMRRGARRPCSEPRTVRDGRSVSAETTVIRDATREVARLKQQPGKPIFVLGSSNLVQTLVEHALVDEYQLWLHPVVIGEGKKLFRDGGPRRALTLVDSRTT